MPQGSPPTVNRSYGGWSEQLFATSIVVEGPPRLVLLSGMGAEDDEDGHIHHVGDVAAQADMCFAKIGDALGRLGGSLADVVKITAYVTDPGYRQPYTESRLRAFGPSPLSTHTFVVVSHLAWPDMLVEVDATAVLPA
jgi:2-iminobutanoate/2-iminopropanoate deaminase